MLKFELYLNWPNVHVLSFLECEKAMRAIAEPYCNFGKHLRYFSYVINERTFHGRLANSDISFYVNLYSESAVFALHMINMH